MTTEQIRRKGKTGVFFNMSLQEALEQKGFKQSDEEIKVEASIRNNPPKIAEKSLEKEDKVTKESKKEIWK